MSEQPSQQRGIKYKGVYSTRGCTVQGGASSPAASGERFRDFRQPVGPQILTQIVIRINSCSVNELTDRADIVAADYRKTASV